MDVMDKFKLKIKNEVKIFNELLLKNEIKQCIFTGHIYYKNELYKITLRILDITLTLDQITEEINEQFLENNIKNIICIPIKYESIDQNTKFIKFNLMAI